MAPTPYIVLLRGINVGGNKLVPMVELKALAEKMGFKGATTLLQSGNLVVAADSKTSADLEATFKAALKKRFDFDIDIFVRSGKEWAAIIADNPFPKEAIADPSHLLVMPLEKAISAERLKALRALIKGREQVEAVGRTLYCVFPDGIGTSKFASQLVDRNLGTSGTGRNWNTVQKLAALAGAAGNS